MSSLDLHDIDLVIFDCDGVLVDSEPLANTVLARHATALGWAMDVDIAMSIFRGMTMDQVHARIEAELNQTRDPIWIDTYYADCDALFRKKIRPIAGAPELVDRVKGSGRKVAVASQGPIAKMKTTLGCTGLWDRFDGHIYSAKQVERPKPFPDLFLHAARKRKTAPQKCCVIEDSLTGVKAAQAANMRVIYLSTDSQNKLPRQDYSFQRIESLDQILRA